MKNSNKSFSLRYNGWKQVAKELNLQANVAQIRTSHFCKERWKNKLQKQFKKLSIFNYFIVIIFFNDF